MIGGSALVAAVFAALVVALQSGQANATCKLKLLQQLGVPAPLPLPMPLPMPMPLPLPPALPALPMLPGLRPGLPLPLPLPLFRPRGACLCGPPPTPLPVLQAPPIVLPACEGPIIPLPSPPIPPPKTIAHKCVCTKTVIKPQIIQRCISIPSVQRYLKRSFAPVIENIAYKACPKCSCGCGGCAC